MKYIVTDIQYAKARGFNPETHLVKKNLICLNEKEVMMSPELSGNIDERASQLSGKVLTKAEALRRMNNSGSKTKQ